MCVSKIHVCTKSWKFMLREGKSLPNTCSSVMCTVQCHSLFSSTSTRMHISCCLGPSATLELLAQLLRNARGPYVTTVPTTPMWSRGKAQAITNLLPFPQQLSGKLHNVA